jgi:hypothetical protein
MRAEWEKMKNQVLIALSDGQVHQATAIVVEVSKNDRTGYAAGDARSAILHLAEEGVITLDSNCRVQLVKPDLPNTST